MQTCIDVQLARVTACLSTSCHSTHVMPQQFQQARFANAIIDMPCHKSTTKQVHRTHTTKQVHRTHNTQTHCPCEQKKPTASSQGTCVMIVSRAFAQHLSRMPLGGALVCSVDVEFEAILSAVVRNTSRIWCVYDLIGINYAWSLHG